MSAAPELSGWLPLRQQQTLRRALGHKIVEIERWLATHVDDFVSRGGKRSLYFSRASGPVSVFFEGGVAHGLSSWPSQLSVLVEPSAIDHHPYSERHRLSTTDAAEPWLRGCLGRTVRNVRIWIFRDDVPSNEARQAGVSYVLDSGLELVYCVHLHGRESGDELLTAEDVLPSRVRRSISLDRANDDLAGPE
jgi:hypothetical protein